MFLLKKNKSKKRKNLTQSIIISSKDININDDIKYVVNQLVDSKQLEIDIDQEDNESNIYYLIDWKSYEVYDQTWKSYEHIAHFKLMFRSFHENHSNKSDDRSLTSINRNRKKIERKSFNTQSKEIRKQSRRKTKAFRLISHIRQ